MLNLIPRVHFPNEVAIKRGSLLRLKYFDSKRAYVIISKSIESSNPYDKIISYLKDAKIESKIVSDVSGDPTLDSVKKLARAMLEFNPDIILGIGGGCILDNTKIARVLYENNEEELSASLKNISVRNLDPKSKLVLIPTTCGTGSEASTVAVVKDVNKPNKIPLVSDAFVPDVVILDPILLLPLPPSITAYTAIDALTHAIESYCSRLTNIFSESCAKIAAQEIVINLERSIEKQDNLIFKEKLQIAAFNAGVAQNATSVGAVHAIAHAFGAHLGVPHGIANSLVLGSVLNYNSKFSTKVEEFIKIIGFSDMSQFSEWLLKIRKLADLPSGWNFYCAPGKLFDLEKIAQTALEDICMKTNSKNLTLEDVVTILKDTKT